MQSYVLYAQHLRQAVKATLSSIFKLRTLDVASSVQLHLSALPLSSVTWLLFLFQLDSNFDDEGEERSFAGFGALAGSRRRAEVRQRQRQLQSNCFRLVCYQRLTTMEINQPSTSKSAALIRESQVAAG